MIFTIRHLGTAPLKTGRLTLRRLTADDAEAMHRNWASDPEVYRYMTSRRMPEIDDVRRFIAQKLEAYESADTYYWAVVCDADGENIGMATLTEVLTYARTANLAYSLGRRWWGQGYAHEAAEAVLAFAFEQVGFRKIYGCHFVGNERSGLVLRACGMRHVGRSGSPIYHHGEYLSFERYELTAKQYELRRHTQARPRFHSLRNHAETDFFE